MSKRKKLRNNDEINKTRAQDGYGRTNAVALNDEGRRRGRREMISELASKSAAVSVTDCSPSGLQRLAIVMLSKLSGRSVCGARGEAPRAGRDHLQPLGSFGWLKSVFGVRRGILLWGRGLG